MVVKTANAVWHSGRRDGPRGQHLQAGVRAAAARAAAVAERARVLARPGRRAFEGKGVFGVEMFLLRDGTLLVNEIAPRPHNSGHYTIEACSISQYDAHLRAILDLPIPEAGLRLRSRLLCSISWGGRRRIHTS